jgi:maleate isomerase
VQRLEPRVGVIEISSSFRLSAEVPGALPDGVVALFSRVRLPRQEVSVAALEEMLAGGDLELAAKQLADAGVALIAFGCTSASFIGGPDGDRRLIERIEGASGTRATTTSTAVVDALRQLGVRRIGVATPYPNPVNRVEQEFFENAGFEVVRIEGLGLEGDREVGRVSPTDVIRLASSVARTPADALFLSCTNLPSLPFIGLLERRLDRPVVSSNSATIWDICRRLGMSRDGAPSLGKLDRAGAR